MAKKIRVVRKTEQEPLKEAPTVPKPIEIDSATVQGVDVHVGDVLLVNHISFGVKWESLELKRITTGPVFHFYSNPPGHISVREERVKVPKQKKIKVKTKETN